MASGKQIAEQNFQAFQTWLASKIDTDFRQMVSRGVLSRKEIAKECGFAKSALDQNPRIKAALREAEDGLRERGVLPALQERPVGEAAPPLMREVGKQRAMLDNERLKRLEQENASLHAENSELKRQLEKYVVLQEALSMTGRIPR
ncbi:MAG: VPA1267 family protein [Polaromonas sp.]